MTEQLATLAEITNKLDALCTSVDESDVIPDNLLEVFADTKLAHAQKLDAYLAVISQLENMSSYYSSRAEKLKQRSKSADKILAKMKERMLFHIEQFPDLPWRSTDGDKFTRCKAQDSLVIDMPHYKTTFNYLVNETFGIEPQFLDVVSLTTINSTRVKKFLQEGGHLEWARLTSNHYLRIT
jgi:hypothetical protein